MKTYKQETFTSMQLGVILEKSASALTKGVGKRLPEGFGVFTDWAH